MVDVPNSREDVSCEMEKYYELLKQWNEKINLVGKTDLERHRKDSLELSQYILEGDWAVDVGSGNGMPGVILSIIGKKIDLIEIDKRKSAFLRTVISVLNLDSKVYEEDCKLHRKHYTVAVSKAFGSVKKMIESCSHLANKFLMIKGKEHIREIQEAMEKYRFSVEIHPISGETNGVILEIWNVE